MASLQETVAGILAERAATRAAALYRATEMLLVFAGILAMMLVTMATIGAAERRAGLAIVAVILVCWVLDWLAHVWVAPLLLPHMTARRARIHWIRSRGSLIGLITFLPMFLVAPIAWRPEGAPLLATLWVLRFARYSKGTDMLIAVLARESEAVLGVMFLFFTILMICAVLAFLAEREAQPDRFGSVPMALWWTITTLTTTGYGDVVPITALGRILAGTMMIIGLVVFGLLAGILATGFSQELRRQEFLRNWALVKRVPTFHDIGPGAIADLAGLLRSRELPARAVLCRHGEPGDSMFFIVSGEVEVLIEPPRRLVSGDFFGEIALLSDRPRNATVITTSPCQLLELDIADFRALAARTPELMRSIQTEADRRMKEGVLG